MKSEGLFDADDSPFALERELRKTGYRAVAGVDEAGRGALAGPVVAAAVILPPDSEALAGRVRDSKKLSPELREELAPLIEAEAVAFGVGVVGPGEIDRVNILEASLQAMRIAVAQLPVAPDLLLVDGNQRVPVAVPQRLIVKGDDRVISIGAASILAKVTRDRLMTEMERDLPGYGFALHKGYGTEEHRRAIAALGPSPQHRRSFRGTAPA
jgi:ribonuclease HII